MPVRVFIYLASIFSPCKEIIFWERYRMELDFFLKRGGLRPLTLVADDRYVTLQTLCGLVCMGFHVGHKCNLLMIHIFNTSGVPKLKRIYKKLIVKENNGGHLHFFA